jgi:outer membrane protein assembly factor BamB
MVKSRSGISGSSKEYSGYLMTRSGTAHVFLVMMFAVLILPTGADAWMFRANPQHTGIYSNGGISPNNVMNWNVTLGTEIISSPSVSDNVVFIGSNDGNVYALDAYTGVKKWNVTIGKTYIESSPAVINGNVYIGSDDFRVYALNATTGAKVWDFLTGGEVCSSPTILNGRVYVGSDDKNLYALNATNGAKIWNATLGNGIRSSPAIADGIVAVLAGSNISAVNASDGSFLWGLTTGYWESSSPTMVNGTVYAGSDNGRLYALNSTTGKQIWQFSPGFLYSFTSPAVVNHVVYIGSGNASTGRIYALDWLTGVEKWNVTIADNWVDSSPAVAGGVVYIGSSDNRVYAVNAATGAAVWNFSTKRHISSSPAVANGIVYLGSHDGRVYAIGKPRAPAVTAVVPATGIRGRTVQISNLSGTTFLPGATVNLTKSGSVSLNATNITVVSTRKITCTFAIPAGAAIGPWNLMVTNPDRQSGRLTTAFMVMATAPPTVTAAEPAYGKQGTSIQIANLSGTGFVAGAKVTLNRTGSPPLNATNVTVVSMGKITCTFAIPAGAVVGRWNVVVANADGQTGMKANRFMVQTLLPPKVTRIVPSSGVQGTTVLVSNLSGTGFMAGALVNLTKSGYGPLNATNITVTGPGKITCTFAIPARIAIGSWNVVVRNVDGQAGSKANGFMVKTPSPPTVTAIAPAAGIRGKTVQVSYLSGTGFVTGALVNLTKTGSAALNATNITVVSAKKITCTFVIPAGAVIGPWNVVVKNGDGQSGTVTGAFMVKMPVPPAVTSLMPSSARQGMTVQISNLSGSGFVGDPKPKVQLLKGTVSINATNITVASAKKITCTFKIPAGAAVGSWDAQVTNADNQSGTKAGAFSVNS